MSDQEIRPLAETLIRSTSNDHSSSQYNQQSTQNVSHSHSINTVASIRPEYLISSDYFAGNQQMGNQMSSARRFFCLFVTFDLSFTSLMWIIIIMLNGQFIMTALKEQVVHYDIHTSLFDIVLVALCRFLVLLFFYAIIRINHWIIVALSVSSTCAFLIAKVLLYNWPLSDQQVFKVLLILVSFVLAWGEAWFLDYKVIPQEIRANQIVIASPDTERTPLIRSYVDGLPSMCTESVGNFYSPLESPEGSMHRFATLPQQSKLTTPSVLTNEYLSRAQRILPEAWSLMNRDDWTLSKKDRDVSVESLVPVRKGKKIYRVSGIVEAPPKYLFEELYYMVELITNWNPAVIESKRVEILNESTDICYQVSANGAGGAVSSRDFVTLRHWAVIDDCYVIANCAVEHPDIPEKKGKYIRGENGVGCCVIRPIKNNPSASKFQWILNTDLKGWINARILEKAFINMMLEYMKNLRKSVKVLKDCKPVEEALVAESRRNAKRNSQKSKRNNLVDNKCSSSEEPQADR